MKYSITPFLLLLLSGLNAVHAVGPAEKVDDAGGGRLSIAAEQRKLEAGFTKEEADCYQKFAVNSCLDKISARRRAALASLKEEENLLNDLERKEKGARQINNSIAKSSPEKVEIDVDRQAKASSDHQGRMAREVERNQQSRAAAANKPAALNAFEQKLLARQQNDQARAELKENASEKARQFDERQNAFSQRRAQHDAEQEKRNKSPSKPLPLPD